MASLPVAALRLDEAAQAQLPRLGLFQVGQLLGLPRAQLARRFGLSTVLRIDQALGAAREALTFRRPATPWFDRLAFFEPISALEDLERVTADICALLCARLEAEGQGRGGSSWCSTAWTARTSRCAWACRAQAAIPPGSPSC